MLNRSVAGGEAEAVAGGKIMAWHGEAHGNADTGLDLGWGTAQASLC